MSNEKPSAVIFIDIENQTALLSDKDISNYFFQQIQYFFKIEQICGFGNFPNYNEYIKYISQNNLSVFDTYENFEILKEINPFLFEEKSGFNHISWKVLNYIVDTNKTYNTKIYFYTNAIGKNKADNNLIQRINLTLENNKPKNLILISADKDYFKTLLKLQKLDIQPIIINFNQHYMNYDIRTHDILKDCYFNMIKLKKSKGKNKFNQFLQKFSNVSLDLNEKKDIKINKQLEKFSQQILSNITQTVFRSSNAELEDNLNMTFNTLRQSLIENDLPNAIEKINYDNLCKDKLNNSKQQAVLLNSKQEKKLQTLDNISQENNIISQEKTKSKFSSCALTNPNFIEKKPEIWQFSYQNITKPLKIKIQNHWENKNV